MCGIAAFYSKRKGKGNIKKYVIGSVVLLEELGEDSAGIYNGTERLITRRVGKPREIIRLIRRQEFKGLALVHTRAATKGSPYKLCNSHPFYTKDWVGVHNGWLFNDDELAKRYELVREGQTDSEVIWRLADSLDIDRAIEKIEGSFRCFGLHIPTLTLHVFGNTTVYFGQNSEVYCFTNSETLLKELGLTKIESIWAEHRIYQLDRGKLKLIKKKDLPEKTIGLYDDIFDNWEEEEKNYYSKNYRADIWKRRKSQKMTSSAYPYIPREVEFDY